MFTLNKEKIFLTQFHNLVIFHFFPAQNYSFLCLLFKKPKKPLKNTYFWWQNRKKFTYYNKFHDFFKLKSICSATILNTN